MNSRSAKKRQDHHEQPDVIVVTTTAPPVPTAVPVAAPVAMAPAPVAMAPMAAAPAMAASASAAAASSGAAAPPPYPRSPDPRTWTVEDVCMWLAEVGLGHLQGIFRAQMIRGDVLVTLTANNLKDDLGIQAFGDRSAFMLELSKLQQQPPSGMPMPNLDVKTAF